MDSQSTKRDLKKRISHIILTLGVLNTHSAMAGNDHETLTDMSKAFAQAATSLSPGSIHTATFQDSFPDAWDDGIGAFTKWLDDVPPDWNDHTTCGNFENGDASC